MLISQTKNDINSPNLQWDSLVTLSVYQLDRLYGKIMLLRVAAIQAEKRIKAFEEYRAVTNGIIQEQEEEIKKLTLTIRRMQQPP